MKIRKEIEDYAKKKLGNRLPAGFDHFSRVYRLAKTLADDYDDEVLHAAAFLHDIEQDIEPHQEASAKAAEKFLEQINFPKDKILKVLEAIKNHIPTGKPMSIEAKMLHDADVLDFLGATGIARLSGITADDWFGVHSLKELKEKIWEEFGLNVCAKKLFLDKSKKIAKDKIQFTKLACEELDKELKWAN